MILRSIDVKLYGIIQFFMKFVAMKESKQSKKIESKDIHKKSQSWTGNAIALLASTISATGSLLMKMTDEDKMLIVLMRCVIQFLTLLPLASYKRLDLTGGNLKTLALIMLRGLFSSVSMNTYAESLKYLPLGDAGAISYTYPVFVTIFACFCLNGMNFTLKTVDLLVHYFFEENVGVDFKLSSKKMRWTK